VLVLPVKNATNSRNLTPEPQEHGLTVRRRYGECVTLGCRGASDVHRQLQRSVRYPSFSRCDRRIRLRSGCVGSVDSPRERADAVALETELEIQVREPPTCHRITVHQIHRRCDGIASSPDETLKKRRLKQLLA
jgi:hypothetical protein